MKPPKCRICGKEHWSTEPHVMGEAGTQAQHRQKVSSQSLKKTELPVVPTKFDRKSYQREYMREYMRRKRAKEKKSASQN